MNDTASPCTEATVEEVAKLLRRLKSAGVLRADIRRVNDGKPEDTGYFDGICAAFGHPIVVVHLSATRFNAASRKQILDEIEKKWTLSVRGWNLDYMMGDVGFQRMLDVISAPNQVAVLPAVFAIDGRRKFADAASVMGIPSNKAHRVGNYLNDAIRHMARRVVEIRDKAASLPRYEVDSEGVEYRLAPIEGATERLRALVNQSTRPPGKTDF